MELLHEWWNSSLAGDHFAYLCSRERQLPYYGFQSPQISLRRYLVDWLALICDEYDVCMTARHLAVAILDFFLDKCVVPESRLKLAGIAALLIAVKYEDVEARIPKIADLNKFVGSNPQYSKDDVMEMELCLLRFHNWSISMPTAAHFFDYFLIDCVTATSELCLLEYDKLRLCIPKYANYFLEISLQDPWYRCHLPSVICAAAVAAARSCFKLCPTWPLELERRTLLRWANIGVLVNRMLAVYRESGFDTQSDSQIPSLSCGCISGLLQNDAENFCVTTCCENRIDA